MPKETIVDVFDNTPGSSLQLVAADQIDCVSTKHVDESDAPQVLVVTSNPGSNPDWQPDAQVHVQSSHSTKDTFNGLPNGQPLKDHSINGTSSGHSIKNFHENGLKGGNAVLSFKIALPSASAELAAATPICAALAIVLASHTNLPEFCFTMVTGGEQSFKYLGESPSSEDSAPESPFGINVDWNSDLQHLLQNVQGRIDPTTTRIHHLSHALPLFFEPRAHHFKDESNKSYPRVMVECSFQAGEVDMSFQFDPTVINPKVIQHVSRQYDHVLQEICAAASESGRLISEFRVADMRDLRDLWRWNSKVPDRVDELVHDIFARAVQFQPDSLAICAHDGELTYRELDTISTHLAHCLIEYGVQGTIVPVHIEKSMWTPVAQLGIMKAGAASVVLDASQPEERLRTIVTQVHPRVVLTSVENEAVTRCLSAKPVMVVGETALAQRGPSIAESELPEVVPSDRLYIVFTSGSTGMPKGAIVTHSNFASAIRHQQKALQFRAGQRVFDFASYAFDVAWSNFLHTITAGGCLCIPSDEERKQDIPAALQKYKAEYAHLTPSVAWFSPDDLPESVEIMQFSGEELKASLVEGFRDKVAIINTYGPAECSVTSTMQLVDTDVVDTNPPIGHGLGSCPWVVSLNEAQLVPIGAIGELWIEGPIVGGGYLNDQEKTNAAFIEDPLWLLGGDFTADQPGRRGRLYRTGDLVRQNRHDGSLSFVGRKDCQVKIRGQRLELGEVEHHLRSTLPSELQKSLEVIVEVVIPHGSKNPALVACVSPLSDTLDSDVETLVHEATSVWDQKLIDVIPSYMIPSACIPFDTFPMTATGKTDRRRLREMAALSFWEHAAPEDGVERTLPTSEDEEKMLQVWSEVLNIPTDKISTDAPFTRLGGDSITAMQVVSRCRAREIVVTVADLLKLRTIRALMAHSKTSRPVIAALASEDDGEGRSWTLSPMQQLFFDAHPEGLNHYTQSFLLRITRHVTLQALREALNIVVQRHGMLRSRFRRNMDTQAWEQVIVPASEDSFLVKEHSDYAGSALEQIVQSRQASLSLENGPVFAADLFDGRPGEDPSLLLSAHHTIIDLVSWRVIWHELEECLTKGPASLPPPPVSFQTWCRLQREEGQELDPDTVLPYTVEAAQLEYWGLEQGDNCFVDSDMHEHIIDAESTALLLGRSNHTLRTETLDILVGALAHSFRQAFTDRSAPAVFLEGHGREPVEGTGVDLAETVGWFTTLHPVPVSGSRTDTLVDAIRYAKDTRASVPDKGRPYIACRYHNAAGREAFADHRSVELLLNYRGIFQQLENTKALLRREDRPDRAVAIREFGDDYQRMALIEINIVVESGRARISTTTHKRMRHRGRLDLWIGSLFPDALRAASQDLLAAPSAPTLADFPLLSISYSGLDALLTGQLAACGVATAAIQDIYPCTPVQEGILLSEKRGAASYRNNWVWRCSSRSEFASGVSPERLIAAWKDVLRRHTVFSTIFASHPETGRSLQVLLDNKVPCVVRAKPGAGKSSMQYLLDMDAPMTGSSTLEYTVTVCQDSEGEVSCRLDMSHALIDASSIPVLLRDLALVYAERGWGDRPYPPPFSNVVGHIHRSLSSPSRLDYWQKHLAGAEKCELLGDLLPLHARRTDGNARYGLIPLTATTSAISGYCREHNITRAIFLEVAWALVLAHFTGMTEVCFGYVCSGRDTPVDRVEAIVGPLISMLVARIDLGAHLKNVLLAVGEQSIEHLSHQHASLAEIHHSVGASGPLFNTAITVREAHQYGSEDGLRLEEMREEDPHEYDVLLCAVLDGLDTDLSIQYRGDYMSVGLAETIANVLDTAISYLIGSKGSDTSVYQSFFEHISGGDELSAVSHWRGRVENFDGTVFPQLPSPFYQPRPQSAVRHVVRDMSWPESYKPASLIQAAWACVQAAHANSDDVCFGVLSSTLEPTLSDLATALPVTVSFGRDEMISDLLGRLQSDSDHASYLNILRIRMLSEQAAHACHFQTRLTITPSEAKIPHSGDQKRVDDNLVLNRPIALSIECIINLSEIQLNATFDSEILESRLVTKMLQQFECALKWLSTPGNFDRGTRDVETASDQDLRTIWGFNQALPAPINLLVHDVFAKTVQRQPYSLAISAWDGELTYQRLNELSTQFAIHLVDRGVGAGSIVPIYIEKSMWTPVAQLAIMKAGGASVLLDSTQPVERARSIANQIKPNVLISSPANKVSALTLDAPDLVILDWTLLDHIQPMIYGRSLPPSSVPSDLLYVVFTSGSTGLPKGAMITHENFASAIHYQQRALGYAPGLRVYDFVSYAFDVTWSNMLHSLTSGACLCIPSDHGRKNDLIGSLQRSEATMVDLTPSILRLLQPQDLPKLSQVILSGEAFTKETLGDWANHSGLLNTYGPAECSVKATMAPVLPSSSENDIGCGEGLATWIVDPNNPNRLAPMGAIGELWLEGPLIGRGYLADPQKTAGAFVEDPLWLLRGGPDCTGRRGRLYRTGDLVRYEGSKNNCKLTFIGRKDSQVKIRGQRVELGEIEYHIRSSLAAKEGIDSVQVLADVLKPSDGANSMLVAFVCAAGGDKAATLKLTAGLADQLQDKLPAYMIPTAYIPVEHMPVGPTGKTDRRRLREIGTSLTLEQLEQFASQPPRRSGNGNRDAQSSLSSTEALLLDAWAVVLRMDATRLSPEDHFLRVGGDSILAMRLVGEARERKLSLTVADIFNWPRLADLACELDGRSSVLLPSNNQGSMKPFSLLGDKISLTEIISQSASLCGVETNQVVDVFPCTPLQVGLLAETFQRAGGNVLAETWLLKKGINVRRLREAWKKVVRANPILRTRIIDLGQHGLVQVIVSDDSPLSEEVIPAHSISLGTPLVSCKISESHFSWTIHHALYDGWSMQLIFDALARSYRSEVIRDAPPFQNFIDYIQNSSEIQAEEFWKNQFRDFDAQNFPILPSKGYKIICDEHLEVDIENITSDGDYTVSTRIRLAWAILLATITDSADASFGAIVSGRQANVSGIDSMTGPTMATVPVRVAIDRSKTVKDLLQQVQLQAANIMPFEQVGLQKIRNFSGDCNLGCRFQSLVVIQPGLDHDPKDALFESSVQTEVADVDPFKNYAICLEFITKPNGICLRADYDSTVVPTSQFRRIADRFENILRQLSMVEAQDKPLHLLDTSSSADRKQIWAWNDTKLERFDQPIHEIFMEVAARQPEAPAVCSWDGDFTYGQVDDISTRIAHTLLQAGLPQSGQRIVPLFFEKSKWTSVCQIAVMKANGTSVALDATLPDGRLQTVMDLAKPHIILTAAAQESRTRALAPSNAHVIVVSDSQEPTFGLPEDPRLPTVDPDTWLYVVFTSGSTGAPKGVIINHSNFASALKYGQTALRFGPHTRAYDFVSYAFDVSWLNVLYTLCAGGCLCVPSHHEIQNEPNEAIARRRANTGFITPTVGKILHGSGLEVINYGGENLPRDEIDYWKDRAQIIHSYGPSECTPISISHILDPARSRVIIGKGLGVRTWVVDPEHARSISAIGDIGELWLEGPLVGQGYLNDPEKTEASFQEQPEWIKEGGPGFADHHARIYRTGDLVRYEEDGNLEFIGRKDAQIKIRGQRVELEEIGYHVLEAIGEATASQVIVDIVKLSVSSERALVAFVKLLDGNIIPGTPEARAYAHELALSTKHRLSATIPSYMIPNSYMIVDSIPTTTSGKVDRGRLRKAASSMKKEDILPVNNIKRREPQTREEIKIHALVAQVLKWDTESFGMDNNFIELGGDSISAMRLVSLAQCQGIPITVTDILTKDRIADLLVADHEAVLEIETPQSHFVMLDVADPITFVEREVMPQVQSGRGNLIDVLPATDMQSTYLKDNLHGPRRSWFYSYIDFAQLPDEDRLIWSCEQLVEHCGIYRTAFVRCGNSFFQAVFDSWKPTIGIVDSDEPIEATFEKFAVDDVKTPAALGAPLSQFTVIRGQDSRARLVFSMSHAIYDAISFAQTLELLANIYNGSTKEVQDFSRYVYHVQSTKTESYSFWRDTLQNSSMTILKCTSLAPTQDGPPTVLVRSVPMALPPFGITQASLFTFACASALGRMTESTDVVLGRVVSGRATVPASLQNVVGPCLNRLPVRVNFTVGETKRQQLATLQKQQAESLAHETTGLIDIVKHCTDWSPDTNDFGCWIQYQNVDEEPVLDLPGVVGALGSREMWDIPVAADFLEIFAIPSQDGMLTVRLIGGPGYELSAKVGLLDEICSELLDV